jgi:hypothetical protein
VEMTTCLSYREDSMEEQPCLHLEVTDEGLCTLCGTDITTQEFADSLPECPASSKTDAADIIKIVTLAKATAEEYIVSQDPNNPQLPKLRWIGTQMVRLPGRVLWLEYVATSFAQAKQLGYKGNTVRWAEILKEFVDIITGE